MDEPGVLAPVIAGLIDGGGGDDLRLPRLAVAHGGDELIVVAAAHDGMVHMAAIRLHVAVVRTGGVGLVVGVVAHHVINAAAQAKGVGAGGEHRQQRRRQKQHQESPHRKIPLSLPI